MKPEGWEYMDKYQYGDIWYHAGSFEIIDGEWFIISVEPVVFGSMPLKHCYNPHCKNERNYSVEEFHQYKLNNVLEAIKEFILKGIWTDEDMISFADWVDWANEDSLKNWIAAGKPQRKIDPE